MQEYSVVECQSNSQMHGSTDERREFKSVNIMNTNHLHSNSRQDALQQNSMMILNHAEFSLPTQDSLFTQPAQP